MAALAFRKRDFLFQTGDNYILMKRFQPIFISLLITALLVFRIWYGIQINFSHPDYTQIYLIGLENALSENWSYWGPDIVWSKTRLPGAMQGILAGVPIKITGNIYSPIVLSNLITGFGLVLLAFYAKKRFPHLSIYFLLGLFLLFPFGFIHGTVLLNTAYLIFAGTLLFISAVELFIYRDDLIFKPTRYFFLIGFSSLFTFQLHLSWVMFLPFILVLLFLEIRRTPSNWWKLCSAFTLGCLLGGLTLIPTLWQYGGVMMSDVEGSLRFDPSHFASFFDLLIRYLGIATFEITNKNEIIYATAHSTFARLTLTALKIFTLIQFVTIVITLFFVKKTKEFKKIMFIFGLTFIMAFGMYLISNKNLEMRTYILLIPIPIYLSLFSYNYLFKYLWVKYVMFTSLLLIAITTGSFGIANKKGPYSFEAHKDKINQAIQNKNPTEFGERRKSIMDKFN
jgi:hypothetical protein